jgi:hypothetical protein
MGLLEERAAVARGIEEACAVFEAAIVEGYPTPAVKVDQCEHGQFGWEDCIACYDIALQAAVDGLRARHALALSKGSEG